MRVDFQNCRDLPVGSVVYDPMFEQCGVVAGIDFWFSVGFTLQVVFENCTSHPIRGQGDTADRLVLLDQVIDLSRYEGFSDPWSMVSTELKSARDKYLRDKRIRVMNPMSGDE